MSHATRKQRPQQPQRPTAEPKAQVPSTPTRRYGSSVAMGVLGITMACFFGLMLFANSQRTMPGHNDASPGQARLLQKMQSRRFRIVPEYQRRMRRVVVSISDADSAPKYHHEILSRLPEYTEIDLLVPVDQRETIEDWVRQKPYRARVSLTAYDPQHRNGARLYLLLPDEEQLVAVDTGDYRLGSQHGTLWAQDLFEVATAPGSEMTGDRTLLLTSCVHKCFQSERKRGDRRVISDNVYLACLDAGNTEVRRLQLAFKGGNVLVDELAGKRLVFCGYDSVRTTRTAWRAFQGEELSDATAAEMFKHAFSADRVVIVGGARPQPELMYHLDQAMLLLGDAVVGVARLIGEPPRLEPDAARIRQVQAFLAELRPLLADLGYTVVDVHTTVENVLHYQHYVNAVPYIDDRTGQKTVLMPVFPAAATQRDDKIDSQRNSELDSRRDEGIVRKNTATLESCGYAVVHVPTRAYELTGGIHCLVNVLQ